MIMDIMSFICVGMESLEIIILACTQCDFTICWHPSPTIQPTPLACAAQNKVL